MAVKRLVERGIALDLGAGVLALAGSPPTWLRSVLAGVLASLAAGAFAAFVRDRLDPAVKSRVEAERLAGAPVIAEIPS